MLMNKNGIYTLLTLSFATLHVDGDEASTLVVGMELSYPPFEMISPEGKPAGISVDIAEALGRYLQRQVVIDNIPFVGLIPALQTRKVELIISSITITEERKQAIAFSDPYLATGLCLLVSANSDLQSIEEANQKGRVIVVKSGTSGELYARRHLPLATVVILEREASAVLEVVQGKADAFIYDQFSVFTNAQKNPVTTRALLKPFTHESWAIGMRKNNEGLESKVNSFIADFRKQGGFERLGDKYLLEQKQAFKKLNIPFIF
jgi:polar amino acid transport system substrate-binding protein